MPDETQISSRPNEEAQSPASISQKHSETSRSKMLLINVKLFSWSGVVFAFLQSACTAVIAISGVRVAIGLPRSHPQPVCNLESAEPAQQTCRSVAPAASDEEKTQFRAFSDRSLYPDPASPRC